MNIVKYFKDKTNSVFGFNRNVKSTLWVVVGIACTYHYSMGNDALSYLDSLRTTLQSHTALHANNNNSLLGMAELYRISRWSPTGEPFARDYYQRVIEKDPTAKAASAILLITEVSTHLAELINAERAIKVSDAILGAEPTLSPTSPYLDYAIRYTQEEREESAALWRNAANEMMLIHSKQRAELLDALERAMQFDSQNALYDYLKAALLIRNDFEEGAITALQTGLEKERLDIYVAERIEARRHLLEQLQVPYPERGESLLSDLSFVSFVNQYVIRPLFDRANHASISNRAEAELILRIIIDMCNQLYALANRAIDSIQALHLEYRARNQMQHVTGEGREEIVRLQRRINGIQSILSRPYPSLDQGLSLEEYNDFVNDVVVNGELRALEKWTGVLEERRKGVPH